MFFIAVTNWKRKVFFLFAVLIVLTLVLSLFPLLTDSPVNSNIQSEDEDILSQPIKVQGEPLFEETEPEENISN
ncbi:MAG: hypothetical protein GXY91_03450 [Clostridia bacterium]|nr:hypothetical protein [Clostridia bacterium]